MHKCYKCSTDLIKSEKATEEQKKQKKIASNEHILPNAIGGQISSLDILCQACNEELNQKLDLNFIRQIKIRNIFKTKLDRKKSNGEKFTSVNFDGITTTSKEKLNVNEDGWNKKPIIEISPTGELLYLKAYSIEQAEKMLTRYDNKYPGRIDVQDLLGRIEWKDESLTEGVNIADYVINYDERLYKAVTKIAINYYLYKGQDREQIKDAINYVVSDTPQPNRYTICYNLPAFHNYRKEDEVSNILYLVGDSKYKLLYCYVEIYGLHGFMVVLNDDYSGEDFIEQYRYDLINCKDISNETMEFKLCINPTLFKSKEEREIYYSVTHKETIRKLDRIFAIFSKMRKEYMERKNAQG